MRKNLKKLLVLMLVIPIILVSCEEEENDITSPGQVVNAQAVGQDQSVLLQWTDPTDTDFEKVIIIYTDDIEYIIEVLVGEEEKIIENLSNNTEYTFVLKTIDKSGNESEEIELTATPELLVFQISGTEIENGTYKRTDNNGFITSYEFSGTDVLNVSLTAGTNNFTWSGTWARDGLSIIKEMTMTGSSDIYKDTVSAALCFELDSKKYYYHGAYEKISGQSDELIGNYEYSLSDDNGTTTKSVSILTDGTYELFTNNAFDKYGSWSEGDIRDKNFVLINFMDKTFLYFVDSFVFIKQ